MLLLCGTTALLWCWCAVLSAQAPPGLFVFLNADSFTSGQTLVVRARLAPLTPSRTVDAYVVVQLPTGQFFSLQSDGSLVVGLHPIARNFVPFDLDTTLAQYIFTGNEPAGTYTWYAVLTQPGTMNFASPLSQAVFALESVLSGRVLDYPTQSAVGGAVLGFELFGASPQQHQATTDMSGTFTLSPPLIGRASVSVNGEDVGLIDLTGANHHDDLFVNWGTCVARYGRVIDSSTLQPVFGATVTLLSFSTATDFNGWYRIDLGCPASGVIGFNTTSLRVTHPQYASATLVVGRGVSRVSRLDVRLSRQ